MPLEKVKFTRYEDNEEIFNKTAKPLAVKLNEQDEEILKAGMYMFNIHSKGGVLKKLAAAGLRYYLALEDLEEWHKLTRGDRTRLVHEKPDLSKIFAKGNTEN